VRIWYPLGKKRWAVAVVVVDDEDACQRREAWLQQIRSGSRQHLVGCGGVWADQQLGVLGPEPANPAEQQVDSMLGQFPALGEAVVHGQVQSGQPFGFGCCGRG